MSGGVLAVVAHPDDESLGCGGTLWRASQEHRDVDLCVLSAAAGARGARPSDEDLASDFKQAIGVLGVRQVFEGDFPNIEFNTVPHLHLVQTIEHAIRETRPATLITHHPADLNVDHQHTAHAALAAARLPQREQDISYLHEVLLMETLSATDWSYGQLGARFDPQHFVEIGEAGVDAKIAACSAYRGVMRPYPHSRSDLAIRSLAASRGAQAGLHFAEAFEVAFTRSPLPNPQ